MMALSHLRVPSVMLRNSKGIVTLCRCGIVKNDSDKGTTIEFGYFSISQIQLNNDSHFHTPTFVDIQALGGGRFE